MRTILHQIRRAGTILQKLTEAGLILQFGYYFFPTLWTIMGMILPDYLHVIEVPPTHSTLPPRAGECTDC